MVGSNDSQAVASLNLARVALRQIHALSEVKGIPRVDKDCFFTWDNDESRYQCFIREKIEGESLDCWLARNGKISQSLAIDWLVQLIRLVDHFHRQRFIHRDIKPDNLIYQDDGTLAMIDFETLIQMDLAYIAQLDSTLGRSIVLTPGTPGYSAPEQNDGKAVPTSDYYAIGRTMVHLLTGLHPVDLKRNPKTGGLSWREHALQVDPLVADFIDSLMDFNPIARPHECNKIIQYLDALPERVKRNAILRSKPVRFLLIGFFGAIVVCLFRFGTVAISNTYVEQGNFLQEVGDQAEAKKRYEQALWFDQQNPATYTKLGESCALLEEFDCAIDNFQQALQIQPDYALAHVGLANVYDRQNNYQLASEHYQQAARADTPLKGDIINNLARLKILQGDSKAAIRLLQSEVSQPNDAKTLGAIYKNLGWAAFAQKDYQPALDWLETAIIADPRRADSYCLLAQVKEQLKQNASADWITCMMLPNPTDQPEISQWKRVFLDRLPL